MHSLFHPSEHTSAQPIEPVPTIFPIIDGASIAAVFVGKRMAGDFYDSLRVSPERVLIGLMDVPGRREDNRDLLITAQEIFRAAGSELFLNQDVNEADAMTELSLRLNRGLIERADRVLSCPAFIACYHEKFGTLCYTNAGHTPGLIKDKDGVIELTSTGLPLGLFSHATAEARIVGLQKGAALLLVSRGVIACEGRRSRSLEELGIERVKDAFHHDAAVNPQDICKSILGAVAEFSQGGPICDDRTALALVRTT